MSTRSTIFRGVILGVVCYGLITLAGCTAGGSLDCPVPTEMMSGTHEGLVPYEIQNESCTTLCSINISPTRCDDWGFDWIRGDSLRSGESITVYLQPGQYDVLLEECTDQGHILEKENVDGKNDLVISNVGELANKACQASVTVINNLDVSICHMWMGTEVSERFGGNWLGSEQIQPGESVQFFVFPDTYDLKAEDCEFNLLRVELDVEINGHMDWLVE